MSSARGSSDGGVSNDWNGWMEAFTEHCENMKCFLKHHDNWPVPRTSPINEMLFYDIRHGLTETGGTGVIGESDLLFLVPIRVVTRRRIAPN